MRKVAMQAVRIEAPECAHVVEKETPQPGPGEVLVEIAAAGICWIDSQRDSIWPNARPTA